MYVRHILETKGDEVATVSTAATLDDVAGRLAEQGVGALVVSDDGETIVGIVSIGDVVKHRLAELQTESKVLHEYLYSGR